MLSWGAWYADAVCCAMALECALGTVSAHRGLHEFDWFRDPLQFSIGSGLHPFLIVGDWGKVVSGHV